LDKDVNEETPQAWEKKYTKRGKSNGRNPPPGSKAARVPNGPYIPQSLWERTRDILLLREERNVKENSRAPTKSHVCLSNCPCSFDGKRLRRDGRPFFITALHHVAFILNFSHFNFRSPFGLLSRAALSISQAGNKNSSCTSSLWKVCSLGRKWRFFFLISSLVSLWLAKNCKTPRWCWYGKKTYGTFFFFEGEQYRRCV
jgi:hypothetical protein